MQNNEKTDELLKTAIGAVASLQEQVKILQGITRGLVSEVLMLEDSVGADLGYTAKDFLKLSRKSQDKYRKWYNELYDSFKKQYKEQYAKIQTQCDEEYSAYTKELLNVNK